MMKKILILLTLLFVAGCSTPSNENSNEVSGNSSAAPPNANQNSKLVMMPNVNAEAFNANNSDLPVANREVTDDEDFHKRPAVDNSVIESTMRGDGSVVETRTFKDHPQLSKVERITNGPKVTGKVYLRSGKTIDLAAEKLKDVMTAAPGNILSAAGIAVPTPTISSENKQKN